MNNKSYNDMMDKAVERIIESRSESPDTITLKRIYSTHCQICGTPHAKPLSIVYYVPLDNVLVCLDCAEGFGPGYEPRIYKEGE